MFSCEIFTILLSYEDENIGRFSNLHQCTFKFCKSQDGQKQSFAYSLQNRCSQKFRKFHKKTSMLESPFNKVAGLKACNFIKIRLQHKSFLVSFSKFLKATFFTEHLRWLLLKRVCDGTSSVKILQSLISIYLESITDTDAH